MSMIIAERIADVLSRGTTEAELRESLCAAYRLADACGYHDEGDAIVREIDDTLRAWAEQDPDPIRRLSLRAIAQQVPEIDCTGDGPSAQPPCHAADTGLRLYIPDLPAQQPPAYQRTAGI